VKLTEFNKQLWDQNDYWLPHWREIQRLALPYRGRLETETSTQNDGKERADDRFDGTATRALRILSAGMHGGLTSPSSKWFRLGFQDRELTKYGPVRTWLDMVEEIMYSSLRRSNFYQAVQNIYLECGGFGTSCLFEESHDSGRGVWFRVITTGDYTLIVDNQGRVHGLSRRDWLTAAQMIEKFGDSVSDETKRLAKEHPFKYVKIYQIIRQRKNRDVNRIDRLNLPYESIYLEDGRPEDEGPLRTGGYDDFPYMCPRWDVIGSNVFGYSPAMDALPDIRSINSITSDLLTAVEKEVNPPVNVPESLWDSIDLLPGGQNPSTTSEHVTPTYQISPNLNAGAGLRDEFKQAISEWFYTPLFILTANPNATATEIAAKNEEQLVQLGPVIQRMFTELLNPVIKRTFSIEWKQGAFPIPPQEIAGAPIEIEYISTLAQAQKLVGVQKLERFVNFTGAYAQIDPSVLDNLDGDAIVSEHANGTGVPASALRSAEEIAQIRQQRAEQAQQQQEEQLANMQLDSLVKAKSLAAQQ